MMRWILPAFALALAGCHPPADPPAPAPPPASAGKTDLVTELLGIQGVFVEIAGITDGDSFTAWIEGERVRVRLEGIDAPELKQPGGSASREALRELMASAPYYLIRTGKDRYGRLLARVEAAGNEVNVAMLRQGMAWHFSRYNKDADLAAAELEARQARRGLWATPAPVAPWDWRKAQKVPETAPGGQEE
jgi:endonuclease YncB( thermonuclease family)